MLHVFANKNNFRSVFSQHITNSLSLSLSHENRLLKRNDKFCSSYLFNAIKHKFQLL